MKAFCGLLTFGWGIAWCSAALVMKDDPDWFPFFAGLVLGLGASLLSSVINESPR